MVSKESLLLQNHCGCPTPHLAIAYSGGGFQHLALNVEITGNLQIVVVSYKKGQTSAWSITESFLKSNLINQTLFI